MAIDFNNLDFEKFKAFAQNNELSKYEKIGFPDHYRQGYEQNIFNDICSKLTNLSLTHKKILDIGPGCSDLPHLLIDKCNQNQHLLSLVDNQEMLDLLPNKDFVNKYAGMFPKCDEFNSKHKEFFDVIICYSVLHYILIDTAFFRFLDIAMSLLAPKGQFLIGDIPNVSKRKRFFASENGKAFHKQFMNTEDDPKVEFNRLEHDQIDDAVMYAIIQRARLSGFDAYILPQQESLPMSNRREDILIVRP